MFCLIPFKSKFVFALMHLCRSILKESSQFEYANYLSNERPGFFLLTNRFIEKIGA